MKDIIIKINNQIDGLSEVELTPTYFPRLFDGNVRVRDISIIQTDEFIDVQTILTKKEVQYAIVNFLKYYQAQM